ncbi:MAG: hypothetical protein ACKVON_07740 [Beijerinckiaceae bacterium]
MSEAPTTASSRSCGDCTLCCKVYPVPVMQKPRNVWCKECKPGRGCGIWQTRPEFCRDFHCTYINDTRLGPEWKPNVCKFVMNWATPQHLHVTVDPGSPLSYRKEPYYAGLKATAERCMAKEQSVIVFSGENKFLMLPDGEHLIGPREDKMEWYVNIKTEGSRKIYTVVVTQHEKIGTAA